MQTSQDLLIQHIEEYRAKHGMNYLELSNKLSIPYSTLTETLRRKRVPRIDTVDSMASAMGTDTYELFLPSGVVVKKCGESKTEDEILLQTIQELPEKKKELLKLYVKLLEEYDPT